MSVCREEKSFVGDELINALKNSLKAYESSGCYDVNLPADISAIADEYKRLPLYGHPVCWAILGRVGMQAIAVGLLNDSEACDDGSEKHFNPPILTSTLASVGPEYAYCQIALILVPKHIVLSKSQNEWLNMWCDQRSHIRYLWC